MNFENNIINKISNPVFYIIFLLLIFGFIMVYGTAGVNSGGSFKIGNFLLFKEFFYFFLGILLAGIFSFLNLNILKKYSYLFILISIILLVLVLLFGKEINGAKRWLKLSGFLNFQPSEFAKIALLIFIANFLDRKHSKIKKNIVALLPLLTVILLICFLIVIEPDAGTPVLIFLCFLSILFYIGIRIKYLLIFLIVIILTGGVLVYQKSYRVERIKNFINGVYDKTSQNRMAKYAFAKGGIVGVGLANSQMKLRFLPESHTDFIFPIIGEEFGFIGTVIIVLFYVSFVFFSLKIISKTDTLFEQILAFGIVVMISIQSLINMGVSTSLLPNKGMPLPFISYGGSSMLFTMIATGLLINISSKNESKIKKIIR